MTRKCFSITSAYSCNLRDSFKLNWRAPCKIIIVLTHAYFLRGNQIVILILTPLQYWWCLFEWWTWLYTKINIFLVDKSHVLQVKETFLLPCFYLLLHHNHYTKPSRCLARLTLECLLYQDFLKSCWYYVCPPLRGTIVPQTNRKYLLLCFYIKGSSHTSRAYRHWN